VTNCWQATPTFTNDLVAWIQNVVTRSDAARRTAAKLVAVAAEEVVVVSDEALCRRGFVAAELRRPSPDTLALVPVLLIRAGPTRYVIYDGRAGGGDHEASWVADSSFTIIGVMSH
jgi:hypothetical protein